MKFFVSLLALLVFGLPPALGQNGQAFVTGVISDAAGKAIELATITIAGTNTGATTDPQGRYRLAVPADQSVTLVASTVSTTPYRQIVRLAPGETLTLNITLRGSSIGIRGFVKRDTRITHNPGEIAFLNPANSNQIASATDGITATIKSLVGSNNELTSQYTVRGGNYDENLVYVNDFEIYRPFLVRSGQQEGLGFVNSDLVSGVNFAIGGFQSRYGDKMSSVLDVTYRRPQYFAGSFMFSLLGATGHLEGASRNEKFTYLVGLRHKSNQYLLQAQPTKGVYNPSFTDAQALLNYRFNSRWEAEAIVNYSRNRFNFVPERSVSAFGLVTQAYQLETFFTGAEIDQFDSRFGGVSVTHRPGGDSSRLRLKFLASGFQTNEFETYDISGEYLLGELETDLGKNNFGQVKANLGTGIIQTYARNYLKVNVGTVAHRGWYDAGHHNILWGLDAVSTSISDRLHEWERRDSGGFTQPYDPDQITMRRFYNSSASFNYMRYSGFLQDNFRYGSNSDSGAQLFVSAGVRFNYSDLNGEFIFSPRVQATYKPRGRRDLFFKAAAGLYAQPPFYREMRDLNGNVNKSLRAQKSAHYVLGVERNFNWGRRPIKVTGEVYYKSLWDLVPYEYDNVRIRYFGTNNAVGYAYGGEVRIYGDLVRDATSWVSIGLLKTSEDITDDKIVYKGVGGSDSATVNPGYIPRPTDQRAMVGVFFQDYLPGNKNFRVNINGLYSTGLPYGVPDQKRYADTLRLPSYKRVDIGFSALLLDAARRTRPAYSFFNNLESVWISAEVFNLLGIQNTLSYSWIQDQSSGKTFAVPNRLTSRLLNVKLIVKF